MCTSSGKQYSHLDPVSSSHVRFCLTTAYVWRWEKLCTRYTNVIQPWLNLCDHIKMSQLLLMRLSGITRVHVIFRNVHDPHSKSDKSTVKCPSQDEALARQFHPRLEKQTLIEERISGHLRVVQPSSENKHWRARERKKHSLKDCKNCCC